MKKALIMLMMTISLTSFASNFSIRLNGERGFFMEGHFSPKGTLAFTKGKVSGTINGRACKDGEYKIDTGLFKKNTTLKASFPRGACPNQVMEFTLKTKDLNRLLGGKMVEANYSVDGSEQKIGKVRGLD